MTPIEKLREALQRIHHVATGQSDRAYMSIPANPREDADLLLSGALDELEALRAEVETLRRELDEAKALILNGARVANALTQDTETPEEWTADLVRQVREARQQRDEWRTRAATFNKESAEFLTAASEHARLAAEAQAHRFCACGRVESDCDQSRASCPKVDPASEGDDETDIIITGRQVPFVQVGMIVHPDDCLNCERDGSPLWCSALVCDIHDDETARFGMMATLLFRNGERREEPCDELRRRWRLARDFDQGRVYTGRWGAIPRGSVWPVAEVNEDA